MSKKKLLILVPFLLISCSHKKDTSSTPSSSGVEEKCIYEFNDKISKNDIAKHEFKTNFKEYTGDLTPTDSSKLSFTLSEDKTYYIVSDKDYHLDVPNLVIPSTYNSLPVEEIASEAFAYKTWLTSVAIPSSIKRIGAGAFNSSSLKTVYYDAENVEDFNGRNWVFYKADAEQNIDIYFGKNVKRIPSRLFYPLATNPNETCNVNNIYFSKDCQIEEIGDYAFYKLKNVTAISLPKTLKKIGKYAFYECGLKEIDLSSIEEIDEYAFSFNNIEYINLDNVLNIGEGAFSYCKNLKYLDLTNSKINEIKPFTFKKCISLSDVNFNDNLLSIGEEAFSYCSSLVKVVTNDNLNTIGLKAFLEANNIQELYLGKNLKTIANYAFYNLNSIQKLYVASNLNDFSIGNYIFSNLGKNSKLTLAFLEGVNYIPSYFLFSSSNVNEIANIDTLILPKSLTKIEKCAIKDSTINKIWYLGNEESYKKITISEQNESLQNVSYAYVKENK